MSRPIFEMIGESTVKNIIDEALEVLEKLGIFVEDPEALELLHGAGARIEKGRACISAPLVEGALKSAPAEVVLYDRDEKPQCVLGGDRTHFAPGSAALNLYDPDREIVRKPVSADLVAFARVIDQLDNIAAQSTCLISSDVPEEMADRYRLYLALKYCRKPVLTGTFEVASYPIMKEMLLAIRGSAENLATHPLAIFDACPSPPLKWSSLTVRSLIDSARSGIPAEIISMPQPGATSPVTLYGALVQHTAEDLSGVVIHQLAEAGAPVIYGGSPAVIDMRWGSMPLGAMETMMIDAAYCRIGKHLGLPTHAYMGLSDAKLPDAQAGLESGMGAMMASLAGVNMVSGPGMIDFERGQCLEKLVIDNEICGMALRLARGISGPGEVRAIDLISTLLEHGHLMSHPHTRKHYRKEQYMPGPVIDRQTLEIWQAGGGKSAAERAREQIRNLLEAPQPEPLDSERTRALEDIMAHDARSQGLAALPELSG